MYLVCIAGSCTPGTGFAKSLLYICGFDIARYPCRNVIERGVTTLKQWRFLATRYDKLAIVYRARRPKWRAQLSPTFINTP